MDAQPVSAELAATTSTEKRASAVFIASLPMTEKMRKLDEFVQEARAKDSKSVPRSQISYGAELYVAKRFAKMAIAVV